MLKTNCFGPGSGLGCRSKQILAAGCLHIPGSVHIVNPTPASVDSTNIGFPERYYPILPVLPQWCWGSTGFFCLLGPKVTSCFEHGLQTGWLCGTNGCSQREDTRTRLHGDTGRLFSRDGQQLFESLEASLWSGPRTEVPLRANGGGRR